MDFTLKLSLLVVILAFFSIIIYFKKSLDFKGIIAGNLILMITFFYGGLRAFTLLASFFILGELGTRYGRKREKIKFERRNYDNILANAGPGVISLVLGSPVAFASGIATALSDTLSSEIGMMSENRPRMITTFKEVEVGTDGGITLQGSLIALVGAFVTASIYYLLIQNSVKALIVITIAGFLGCMMDSLLGALFESKKKITNSQTNFLACSFGAIVGWLLIILI